MIVFIKASRKAYLKKVTCINTLESWDSGARKHGIAVR
jgi:hypothetical protein